MTGPLNINNTIGYTVSNTAGLNNLQWNNYQTSGIWSADRTSWGGSYTTTTTNTGTIIGINPYYQTTGTWTSNNTLTYPGLQQAFQQLFRYRELTWDNGL
jgi:hypothetical protein